MVEGASDEQAARKIVAHCGGEVRQVLVAGGKSKLDPRIPKYVKAAEFEPWVVFRDSDNVCPVDVGAQLLRSSLPGPMFSLRLAHTMTEAWLMADREGCARYFGVSPDSVPLDPEAEPHAKRALLALCLRSRDRRILEGVAHDQDHAGPLFVHHMNEFARTVWDVEAAVSNSASLKRAVRAIGALPAG